MDIVSGHTYSMSYHSLSTSQLVSLFNKMVLATLQHYQYHISLFIGHHMFHSFCNTLSEPEGLQKFWQAMNAFNRWFYSWCTRGSHQDQLQQLMKFRKLRTYCTSFWPKLIPYMIICLNLTLSTYLLVNLSLLFLIYILILNELRCKHYTSGQEDYFECLMTNLCFPQTNIEPK